MYSYAQVLLVDSFLRIVAGNLCVNFSPMRATGLAELIFLHLSTTQVVQFLGCDAVLIGREVPMFPLLHALPLRILRTHVVA
jgi:hypothetical protein